MAADGLAEDALRMVDPLCKAKSLEGLALRVVNLLAMQRRDLAQQTVDSMEVLDDDSSLSQLCRAWLALARGKASVSESHDGLSEANLVFKDLSDRFGSSALLLNGQAAALMALGLVGDAQSLLADAAGSGTQETATNSNFAVLSYHLGGDSLVAEKYIAAARASAEGGAPLLASFDDADAELKRIVDAYKSAPGTASA
jgi:coatomer protein complex subunit epsilon